LALINHRTHEIHFKIVYYGPGLCGKTTNLKSLHDRLPPERRGKMISIATDQERTLFFDFLPIDLGHVNGFLTRFHLYTVPGQVYYRLSRRAVLQGVDGLVFVADSHPAREAANRESLADLHEHLRTLGVVGPAAARIPWVYQWNKRDVPVAVPIERLRKALNPQGWPEFEAVASENKGVSETLRAACKAVLARLGTGHAAAPAPAAPSATAPVAAHAVAAGSSPSPLAGPHVPQAGTALAPPPAQPLPMQASPASVPRTAPIPGSGHQILRSPAFAPRPAAEPPPAAAAPAAPPAKPPVLPPIDRTRRP
jgi:signal recognition particle receptor subunit beta